MPWQDHIELRSNVLSGKPVVRGTRLSAEFVLSLFANGWSQAQVLENYPQLSPAALQAVFAFSVQCMQDEQFVAHALAA